MTGTVTRFTVDSADRTDEELMRDLRDGAGGGTWLFDRYREPLWRFFRRRVRDAAKAEELAQDVFAAVIEAAPSYQPRGRFRSYLFGIAYNLLMADRRRCATATPFDGEPDAAAADGVDADRVLWVQIALRQLDQTDREILMLREYEGLSYDEIAELQQVPINTVRSRLFRARVALREALMPRKEEAP